MAMDQGKIPSEIKALLTGEEQNKSQQNSSRHLKAGKTDANSNSSYKNEISHLFLPRAKRETTQTKRRHHLVTIAIQCFTTRYLYSTRGREEQNYLGIFSGPVTNLKPRTSV
ncbi:cAMP-responsive element-binding protein-like 2 [Lagenorhynchus albirostris]|uniref:cAMP-responsive element-binding protein-like 2 n=1 Tax=Lagenorhynchus albirostris TaxID=27610 RepID=UPI0028EE4E08|nr:cAMP-responsive element-binding protein-like 2 [Lagenorhynchus albirostris]